MTVSADDQIPGPHQSLLGKRHMLDPDALLEGVREILSLDEVSKDLLDLVADWMSLFGVK